MRIRSTVGIGTLVMVRLPRNRRIRGPVEIALAS